VFYRSDDGGVTLNELPFNPSFSVRSAYVAGIDPTNPDVVYVRAGGNPAGDADTQTTPTALLRSDDGGMNFRVVARSDDPMLGFAISDDGQTVWFGASSPQGGMLDSDGLFRSDDRGLTFSRIGMQQVQCLRQHAGTLYLCGNFVLDHFALGRSTDRGDHFETVLQFDQLLGPPTCPASSAETSTCAPQWPSVRGQFVTPMDAGSPDAGTTPTPGGCHCAVPGTPCREPGRVSATLALLFALSVARRRRARA
jgi:hypothetical protein